MLWIAGVMLVLIVGSTVADLALPEALKERIGVVICWGMMAITMTFLSLASLGLLWMLAFQVILPKLLA